MSSCKEQSIAHQRKRYRTRDMVQLLSSVQDKVHHLQDQDHQEKEGHYVFNLLAELVEHVEVCRQFNLK